MKYPTKAERRRYLEDAVFDFPVLCMRVGNLRMLNFIERVERAKKRKAKKATKE